jgi:hypothetical protein
MTLQTTARRGRSSDGHRLAVATASGAAAAGRRCGWLRPRSVTSGGCGRLHVLIIMRPASSGRPYVKVAVMRRLAHIQVQSD